MRRLFNENKLLFVGVALSILFFSGFLLFNNQIFIFEGDVLNQNVKMTLQAWERLHNGEGFLWNWSNFLGANYIGTATYYGFGSVFFWLMVLMPFKEWVIPMFLYTNILKAMLCTTAGYFWIKKAHGSKEGAFVASLIVSFSGFVLTNYNNNVMFDAICLMPLCLYFAECFLQENRGIGLALSIGWIGLTNYYFLYLFLPFLCLYTLFRYLMLNEFHWKSCMIKGLQFVVFLLLGVGLSAVLLLPSYLALANNPRSSVLPSLFDFISKFDLYRLITGFLNPINDWRINNNYYVNTSVYEGIGYSGGMAVYSMMIFPFLFPLLFLLKNNKEKLVLLGFYLIYGGFCLSKFFYVLFNQNLESRWMMNLIFLNAFLVGYLIKNRKEIKKKYFGISMIFGISLILCCLLITKHFYFSPDLWGWQILVRNAVIGAVLLFLYYLLFTKVEKERYFHWGLVGCLALELVFSYYNVFYNDGYNLDPMTSEELAAYQLEGDPVIEQIRKDEEFYRVDLQTLNTLHENDSYLYQYHSFNGYTSIYNYNQFDFMTDRFKIAHAWNFYPQPGKWLLKSRLGSKYFIQAEETDQIPYGFVPYIKTDSKTVYLNQYPLSFAYAKKGQISVEDLSKYSIFMQDRLLITNVAKEQTNQETDFTMIENLKLLVEGQRDWFQVDVSKLTGGYLYVEFLEHTSVAYEVYDSRGEMIDYNYLIRDLSYAAIPLLKDAAYVNITVLNAVNVYYDDMVWYEDWYQETLKQSAVQVEWTENSIQGIIALEEASSIFTSIPYDQGWTLYVDNQKQDYFMADNGFIGFELDSGKHKVRFNFYPRGLNLGGIITLLSFMVLTLLSFKKHICKRKGK